MRIFVIIAQLLPDSQLARPKEIPAKVSVSIFTKVWMRLGNPLEKGGGEKKKSQQIKQKRKTDFVRTFNRQFGKKRV